MSNYNLKCVKWIDKKKKGPCPIYDLDNCANPGIKSMLVYNEQHIKNKGHLRCYKFKCLIG